MFETITKTATGYRHTCDRCGGIGRVEAWGHVEGGLCFKCEGEGVTGKSFATLEALDAHVAKLAVARDKREAKREAERLAYEAELAQWKHLDAHVDETVTVTGVVAVSAVIDTQWGSSKLIVIETPEREAVKLFTSANWAWGVERDETVTVTGTVKSFDNYDGKPQTVLSRPKRV